MSGGGSAGHIFTALKIAQAGRLIKSLDPAQEMCDIGYTEQKKLAAIVFASDDRRQTASYMHSPEESRKRIFAHLSGLLPDAAKKQLVRLIG